MDQILVNVEIVNWNTISEGDIVILTPEQLDNLKHCSNLVPNFPYVVRGDYNYGFDVTYGNDNLCEVRIRNLDESLWGVYRTVVGSEDITVTPVKPIVAVLPDITTASLDTLVSIVTNYPETIETAKAELSARLSPILGQLTRVKKAAD